jgi:excisionase family DNA binding protein
MIDLFFTSFIVKFEIVSSKQILLNMETLKSSLLRRLELIEAHLKTGTEYLTTNQVAGVTGLSKMAIYQAVHRGTVKRIRKGGRIFIGVSELPKLTN